MDTILVCIYQLVGHLVFRQNHHLPSYKQVHLFSYDKICTKMSSSPHKIQHAFHIPFLQAHTIITLQNSILTPILPIYRDHTILSGVHVPLLTVHSSTNEVTQLSIGLSKRLQPIGVFFEPLVPSVSQWLSTSDDSTFQPLTIVYTSHMVPCSLTSHNKRSGLCILKVLSKGVWYDVFNDVERKEQIKVWKLGTSMHCRNEVE